jgi:hypothetical protein
LIVGNAAIFAPVVPAAAAGLSALPVTAVPKPATTDLLIVLATAVIVLKWRQP